MLRLLGAMLLAARLRLAAVFDGSWPGVPMGCSCPGAASGSCCAAVRLWQSDLSLVSCCYLGDILQNPSLLPKLGVEAQLLDDGLEVVFLHLLARGSC